MAQRTFLAFLLLLPFSAALADDANEQLENVQEELEAGRGQSDELRAQEEKLAAEIAALQTQMIETARAAQDLEQSLSSVEATLAALKDEMAEKRQALEGRRAELAEILGALVRLSLVPPEAMLARPGTPLDLVRSGLLLKRLLPLLEARAASLKVELADLKLLEADVEQQNADALEAAKALEEERQRLDELVAAKRALQEDTAEARQAAEAKVAALESEAETLRDLIAELEAEAAAQARAQAEAEAAAAAAAAQAQAEAAAPSPAPEPTPSAAPEPAPPQVATVPPGALREFPSQPGGITLPARGDLLAGFGDALPDVDEESRGILIATRPGAQIVATFDGRVVYAGSFRRYGLILILEHQGRYHSLLAGLGRIDVIMGQAVKAGEPVGLMTSPTDKLPTLYIELRQDGVPIDPLPWFATSLARVEG